MIQIPRTLCRDLRAVLRKFGTGRAAVCPPIELISGRSGLTIRCTTADVAVLMRRPGRFADERMLVSLTALADCEGRDETSVTFRSNRAGRIEVAWKHAGVPNTREYPAPSNTIASPFPIPPTRFTASSRELLAALVAAGCVTDSKLNTRFVLSRIQLRGGVGEIIATDSKQLLLQGGFSFPWSGDVLVPKSDLFAALAAISTGPVSIARTASHVWIETGIWAAAFKTDATGKFPDSRTLVARTAKAATELILDPTDRELLMSSLPGLPGKNDDHRPITLDLGRHIIVRAKGEGDDHPVEIVLPQARITGKSVRVACDRTYLLAALKMGFGRVSILSPDQLLVCREGARTYLFMSLSGDVIDPSTTKSSPAPARVREPERRPERPAATRSAVAVTHPNRPVSNRSPSKPLPKRTDNKPRPTRGIFRGFFGRIGGLFWSTRR